jgi:hypothetical protein
MVERKFYLDGKKGRWKPTQYILKDLEDYPSEYLLTFLLLKDKIKVSYMTMNLIEEY